jgi:hypothetical protein
MGRGLLYWTTIVHHNLEDDGVRFPCRHHRRSKAETRHETERPLRSSLATLMAYGWWLGTHIELLPITQLVEFASIVVIALLRSRQLFHPHALRLHLGHCEKEQNRKKHDSSERREQEI